MTNARRQRPRPSDGASVTWSWQTLAADDELFGDLEQTFSLKFNSRTREFIARELAIVAHVHPRVPTAAQYSTAKKKLVQETEAFLRLLEEFRTSSELAKQWAVDQLIFASGEPKYGYGEEGAPDTVPRSKLEMRLSDAALNLQLGRPVRGRPKMNRERIFCALYITFEAAGGRPTANYNDIRGAIDSKFVQFLQRLVKACPAEVQQAMGSGIASAIRGQLRAWREYPGSRGGPDHTAARQQFKYLVAAQACDVHSANSLADSPLPVIQSTRPKNSGC